MSDQVQDSVLTRIVNIVATWRQRARDRSALAALGQHELRDLGLGRDAIRMQSSNPVWRG